MKNEFIFKRNEVLAKDVVDALIKRNFNAFYCEDIKSTNEKILELIPKEDVVPFGGSTTLDEIGIKNILYDKGYKIIDRDKAKSAREKQELTIKSLSCDTFLMSANAISKDGQIVNIDGLGNRVAALCFGPKKVIMVCSVNKIESDLDCAIKRARNYAAPINAKRIDSINQMNTPCILKGSCFDCKSETSICSQILITRLSRPKGRINVILVNEELGF